MTDPVESKAVAINGETKNLNTGGDSQPTPEDEAVARQRYMLGLAYMLAMGMCGIVLVAIGSNLKQLASNCHTTATRIGSVFIVRGIGAVFGAVMSAKLYKWFNGNYVMVITLCFLSGLIMILPLVADIYTMHTIFGLLGCCTAITDTGCQIQTRKAHGINAGPWLGVNTVVFSVSGALVPVIALLTSSLMAQCGILAGVTFISAIVLCVPKSPDHLPPPVAAFSPRHKMKFYDQGLGGEEVYEQKKSFSYVVEILASWEALWLIGGKVAATSYFTTYVDETGVISEHYAGLLIVMLWVGISVGRVIGIFDQIGINVEKLYLHLYLQLWGGAIAMAAVLMFPTSGVVLWVGVIAYGAFNGPAIGYVYDLCNRTTAASEKGMSIVMFGLNVGASVVPYLVSGVWDAGGGPVTLPAVILASHLLPIPCQYAIRRLTKVPAVVTWSLAREVLCGRKPSSGSNLDFGDDVHERDSLLGSNKTPA